MPQPVQHRGLTLLVPDNDSEWKEFYAHALLNLPEARAGRDFLRARGFDGRAAERFGVGFAPRGGESLSRHLRSKGLSDEGRTHAGLSGRGSGGV